MKNITHSFSCTIRLLCNLLNLRVWIKQTKYAITSLIPRFSFTRPNENTNFLNNLNYYGLNWLYTYF